MSYTEIAAPDASENKFRMEDRLEAVSKFAKLLERSDEEAMDAISKILMIITEVTQMILQVFKSIGCTLSIADAYTALLSLYSNQIYPMKRHQVL